jgi:hypothetical protein
MAITPSRLPPWIRNADITDYGGHVDKQNYLGIDVIDPTTDQSAAQFSSLVQDVAAVDNTAPFAVICATLSGGELSVHGYRSMYGNGIGNMPDVLVDGYSVEFTWDSEYADAYGQMGSVNIIGAISGANDCAILAANRVQVTLPADGRFTLIVWT